MTGSDLRTTWVDFLARYHWDLFGSLTFREETHPESAYKRFRLFISIINRKLYGPRWHKHGQGVAYCVAMERQRRGVVHFHCLLADPELRHLLRGSWFRGDNGRWANELLELWNELAGFARIEPIRQLEAVERYCSKYVIKGGEIDLGGPLRQRRLEEAPGVPIAKPSTQRSGGLGAFSASVPAHQCALGATKPAVSTVQGGREGSPPPLEASRTRSGGLVEVGAATELPQECSGPLGGSSLPRMHSTARVA